MQQPAQAPKYFVIRADHLLLLNVPQIARQMIEKQLFSDTPNEAIEMIYASFGSSALPNVTNNYAVMEVTRSEGRYILMKHSELTAAQINKELWERNLKQHQHKIKPLEVKNIQNILRHYNESPLIIHGESRENLQKQRQQLAELYEQLLRDNEALRQARDNLLQPAAASPSPVQRNNPSPPRLGQLFAPLGKPAAQAAAAPSPLPHIPSQRDLNREGWYEEKDIADLSAMKRFLGMSDEQINNPNAKKYFTKLNEILPNDFFQQSVDHQFKWVMNNRRNETLFPILKSNPPLACLFLDRLVAGDLQKRHQLKATRFAWLYDFADILEQNGFRQRYGHLEIDVQIQKAEGILGHILERLHVQMLQRQAERARQRQPLIVPEVKEGLRTQKIHDLHQQDKLSRAIDDNLCCMFTGRLFKDPVKLTQVIKGESHIFHFERSQIMLWHSSKKKVDGTAPNPFNNVPFKIDDLKDAPEMVAKVEAFKKLVEKDLIANFHTPSSSELPASLNLKGTKP